MKRLLFLSLLTLLLSAIPLSASTYYVATTGNDSNNCTLAMSTSTPKRTLTSGSLCATAAGDHVQMRGGTYAENALIVDISGSAGNYIIIESYPGETVIIQPSAVATICGDATGAIRINCAAHTVTYVEFSNLQLDCANAWATHPGAGPTCFTVGASDRTTHHIRFRNVDVTNSGGTGDDSIHLAWPNCWGITQGNTYFFWVTSSNGVNVQTTGGFEMIGGSLSRSAGVGGYGSDNDMVLDGVNVYENCGKGFQKYPGGNTGVFKNNTFSDNDDGLVLSNGTGTTAFNNIFYDNRQSALAINNETSDTIYFNTSFRNGVMACCGQAAINAASSTGTTIKNNIAYGDLTASEIAFGTGSISGNNLTTNPSFVSTGTPPDLHITTGSAAKDAGTTISGINLDKDGIVRPQGVSLQPDIGAYEFFATNSVPTEVSVATDTFTTAVSQCLTAYSANYAATFQSGSDCVQVDAGVDRFFGKPSDLVNFIPWVATRTDSGYLNDQYAKFTMTLSGAETVGDQIGPGCRWSGTGSARQGYQLLIAFPDQSYLQTVVAGVIVETLNFDNAINWVSTDIPSIYCLGNQIIALRNGTEYMRGTSTLINTGKPALLGAGNDAAIHVSGDSADFGNLNPPTSGTPGTIVITGPLAGSIYQRPNQTTLPLAFTPTGLTGTLGLWYSKIASPYSWHYSSNIAYNAGTYNFDASLPATTTLYLCLEQDVAACGGTVVAIAGPFTVRGQYSGSFN